MQLEPEEFLSLAEQARTLVCFDIEATGLRGDYNSVLVVSVKKFGRKPTTLQVLQPGNDQRVVREAKDLLEAANCWVGYYSKGFDIPMLNTRLLKWGYEPIEKRPHVDLYYTLKYNLLTSRKSQAHLLEWLETPEHKMTVTAELWNKVLYDFDIAMTTLVKRCESDTAGLEALYKKTKHLIADIKR